MKTKRVIIILSCVLLAAFLLGLSGTATLADPAKGAESAGAQREDKLVGVLITTEYLDLFDLEGYVNDHAGQIMSGGEISACEGEAYSGRLYATLVDKPLINEETGETTTVQEYVFEGVEGICYYAAAMDTDTEHSTTTGNNDAISDGHIDLSVTDEGETVSLEGTIYVSTSGSANTFYYNPVYQTADGELYATTGSGSSLGGEVNEGMSHSQTLKSELTYTKNGKTTTDSTSVKVSVSYMYPPERVVIIQMDDNSGVVSREDYAPGSLPDTLTPERETAYIIVETYKKAPDGSESMTRELFQPDNDTLTTFSCRDDGICVEQWTQIEWENENLKTYPAKQQA